MLNFDLWQQHAVGTATYSKNTRANKRATILDVADAVKQSHVKWGDTHGHRLTALKHTLCCAIHVPVPYIARRAQDEVFHVPMTEAYCKRDFGENLALSVRHNEVLSEAQPRPKRRSWRLKSGPRRRSRLLRILYCRDGTRWKTRLDYPCVHVPSIFLLLLAVPR